MSKLDEAFEWFMIERYGWTKDNVLETYKSSAYETFKTSAYVLLQWAKKNAKPLDPHSVTHSYETQVISIDKLEEFFKTEPVIFENYEQIVTKREANKNK